MATILDLTHPLAESTPVYPGTEPPSIRQLNTVERDGYAVKSITLHSHTGTHIDAPAHMRAGASTLDQLGAAHFVGTACVLATGDGPLIPRDLLEAQASLVEGCDFVLFHTGWSRFWGQERYFEGFPVLSPGAAAWLTARPLKGVGFDTISVDAVGAEVYANHHALFRAGMISIENLAGLEPLVGKRFLFACLPLSLVEADGSPVRAVALLD